MQSATADPRFAEALSVPPIGPGLLGDLARIAITLYWQTSDFTVLHMMTATHAARVLFERTRDSHRMMRLCPFGERPALPMRLSVRLCYLKLRFPGLSPSPGRCPITMSGLNFKPLVIR